ncbi:MAG: DNA ligase (NAD+) [Candidatus Nanohaloarchaea archaeon]|jgi:DNA ligase (NAD+)
MKEPQGNQYVREPELDFKDPEELSEKEAEEQVELLREAVEYHDYRYYVENDPVISDRAYDILFDRLQKLEQEYNLQTENSPTQRVGGETLDELETREHRKEMLSLDASEEEEEVRDFDERVRRKAGEVNYHIEPKFDGLSVEFVYENGELEAAVTRGNGREGDDITANVQTIGSVPLKLHGAPDTLVLRGEIYMPRNGFQQLNKERVERGEEPFANPRNAAAGTVRQLDPSVVADRPLDVFFYDIMASSKEDLETQKEAMDLMEEVGLKVNEYNRVVEDIDGFIEYRDRLLEKRDDLNYDIDGVVAKVNRFEKREILGKTAAHPRWAFAYKFPAKTGTTTVRDIAVQVGRTGKLTPVALLEPVDVKGVTISRASLHNEKQAQKLGISRGAKVEVERAGDVIPQVKEVKEEGEEVFKMPEKCPVCGSDVIGEKEHHFCTGGVSCPAQLKRKLEYFASEEAMDIEGLGEKVAEQLVDENIINKIPELYSLEREDLLQLEKFADKSAGNLLEEIEKSKEVDLASFLTALGIRHVGKETARDLAGEFTLQELMEADREKLEQMEDIGPEVSKNITRFFEGRGRELVEKLLEVGVQPEREETGEELEGLKLVITGNIEGYTREELIDLLERYGADVTSSVSSETGYLVVGENPGTMKIEDAEKEGVEKLDEDSFREKLLSEIE